MLFRFAPGSTCGAATASAGNAAEAAPAGCPCVAAEGAPLRTARPATVGLSNRSRKARRLPRARLACAIGPACRPGKSPPSAKKSSCRPTGKTPSRLREDFGKHGLDPAPRLGEGRAQLRTRYCARRCGRAAGWRQRADARHAGSQIAAGNDEMGLPQRQCLAKQLHTFRSTYKPSREVRARRDGPLPASAR